MSVKMMSWVWDNSPYTGNAFTIHLALADVANEDNGNRLWLTRDAIARKSRCSVDTVDRTLAKMLKDCQLSKLSAGGGKGHAAEYQMKGPQSAAVSESKGRTSAGQRAANGTPVPICNSNTTQEPFRLEAVPALAALDAAFQEFWDIYPLHKAKATALKAFARVYPKVSTHLILEGARRYRDDPNRDPKFTKHPGTWLNGGCWDDESPPGPSATPSWVAKGAPRIGS